MSKHELTEEELQAIDNDVPRLVAEALREARDRALAVRGKVMESAFNEEDGKFYLVETYKDGTRRWIQELPPPVKVVPGSKVRLKHRTIRLNEKP